MQFASKFCCETICRELFVQGGKRDSVFLIAMNIFSIKRALIPMNNEFWPNFHPYTVHYEFWSNFHPSTIHYEFWDNFHPSTIHYEFWDNFHPSTIHYEFWANFHLNCVDEGDAS